MNRITKYYKLTICLVLGVALLGGCKTSKKVGTVASTGVKDEAVFFTSLKEQAIQYNTLSARGNISLDKGISGRLDLKIIKDEALQLSASVPILGIEAFRLEMTPDSLLFIDRLNKRYVADNYEKLRSQTPIAFNFYNLQALFTNHIFIPGEKEFSSSQYERFTLLQESPAAEIRIRDNLDILYMFTVDGEEKLLATTVSDPSFTYHLNWKYENFERVDNQPFPMQMNVQVSENDRSKGGFQLSFSRVQLNESFKLETPIPTKYQRVSLDSLLKSLTKNL